MNIKDKKTFSFPWGNLKLSPSVDKRLGVDRIVQKFSVQMRAKNSHFSSPLKLLVPTLYKNQSEAPQKKRVRWKAKGDVPMVQTESNSGEGRVLFAKQMKKTENNDFYTSYTKLTEIKLISIGLASPERIRRWAEKTLPNGKVIGQVTNANTLHHKTFKPQKGGLFCERIFGPLKDFECACGKTKKPSLTTLPLINPKMVPVEENPPLKKTMGGDASSTFSPHSTELTPPLFNLQGGEDKKPFLERLNQEVNAKPPKRIYCPVCDVEYTWSVMRRYQLGYINLVLPVTHVWYLKATPSYLAILLDIKKKHLEHIVYCVETMTLAASLRFFSSFCEANEKKRAWGASLGESASSWYSQIEGQKLVWASTLANAHHHNLEKKKLNKSLFDKKKNLLAKEGGKPLLLPRNKNKQKMSFLNFNFFFIYLNKQKKKIKKRENKSSSSEEKKKGDSSLNLFSYLGCLAKYKRIYKKIKKRKKPPRLRTWRESPTFSAICGSLAPSISPSSSRGASLGGKYKKAGSIKQKTNSVGEEKFHVSKSWAEWQSLLILVSFSQQTFFGIEKNQEQGPTEENFLNGERLNKEDGGIGIREIFQKLPIQFYILSSMEGIVQKKALFLFSQKAWKKIFKTAYKKALSKNFWRTPPQNLHSLAKHPKETYINPSEAPQMKSLIPLQNSSLEENKKMRENFQKTSPLSEAPQSMKRVINLAKTHFIDHLRLYIKTIKKAISISPDLPSFSPLSTLQKGEVEAPHVGCFAGSLKQRKPMMTPHSLVWGASLFVSDTNIKMKTQITIDKYAIELNKGTENILNILAKGIGRSLIKNQFSKFTKKKSLLDNPTQSDLFLVKKRPRVASFPPLLTEAKKIRVDKKNHQKLLPFGKRMGIPYPLFSAKANKAKRAYNRNSILKGPYFFAMMKFFQKIKSLDFQNLVSFSKSKAAQKKVDLAKSSTPSFILDKSMVDKKKRHLSPLYKPKCRFLSYKMVNNIYSLSHRYRWEHDVDWTDFLEFILSPMYLTDLVIPKYEYRLYESFIGGKNERSQRNKWKALSFNKFTDFLIQKLPRHQNFSPFPPYQNCIEEEGRDSFSNREILPTKSLSLSGGGLIQKLLTELNLTPTTSRPSAPSDSDSVLPDSRGKGEVLLPRREGDKGTELSSSLSQMRSVPPMVLEHKEGDGKNELYKMDKQNRILLYELNKEIFKYKKFSISKPVYAKRRLKELIKQRDLLTRRTKLVRKLFISSKTGQSPGSMILSLLPVLPPDLRPIVKMGNSAGNVQIAASDLNRLYQRVIYRNERLKKFLNDPATGNSKRVLHSPLSPSIPLIPPTLQSQKKNGTRQLFTDIEWKGKGTGSTEIKFTQGLLQEAVDNLIQNNKSGVPAEKDSRGRALKSLSDILKGKQGRFRQYLLGKRVDYSGRSVIIVGPKLKIHECGIPKEMALELYLPFLLKRILNYNLARTVVGAKSLINKNKPLVWELLTDILRVCPVLLNRAPTLHRLGIQAFIPKLVDGRAILLHPLVCSAFNADFDGDQMAVHVPITVESRAEAWKLMLSRNNLLSPATGDPISVPSQDMVLGCYYLTTLSTKKTRSEAPQKKQGFGLFFKNEEDVLKAYHLQKIDLHATVWIQWDGLMEDSNEIEHPIEIRISKYGNWKEIYTRSHRNLDYKGNLISHYFKTTPGKILFNGIIKNCISSAYSFF